MVIEQKEKNLHRCNLCGYFWYSKLLEPKTCARCKRYDYNKNNTLIKENEENKLQEEK